MISNGIVHPLHHIHAVPSMPFTPQTKLVPRCLLHVGENVQNAFAEDGPGAFVRTCLVLYSSRKHGLDLSVQKQKLTKSDKCLIAALTAGTPRHFSLFSPHFSICVSIQFLPRQCTCEHAHIYATLLDAHSGQTQMEPRAFQTQVRPET